MDSFLLEIIEGSSAGRQVQLDGPLEIGRDPGCGLALDDDRVSRRHARVSPQNGAAVAEDLGSTNGTYLNGMMLYGPTVLSAGDHLLIGVTVLELRTRRDVEHRPSAVGPRPAFAMEPVRPNYIGAAADLPDPRLQKHRLDPLLDVRTKHQARIAPLGVGLVVTFAVILFLALR
jgi:predicted component of type VI protein secretion system